MDVNASLLSDNCTQLAVYNFNIKDENKHLYYQLLAMKIFIFTYRTTTIFTEHPGLDIALLSLPLAILNSINVGGFTLLATLHYIILMACACFTPIQIHYLLALMTALQVPELEHSINVYICLSEFYLFYRYLASQYRYEKLDGSSSAFVLTTCALACGKLIPVMDVWKYAVGVIIVESFQFENMRPLAWVHIPCSIIISMVHDY